MNALEATLRRIPRDMKRVDASWALIGGFAVSAYAGGRATADIDLAVAIESNREVDRIVFGLTQLGYEVGPLLEDVETGLTSTVRMFSPEHEGRRVLTDLLVSTSGIESEVVAAATVRQVRPGFRLPIASLGHLIALKILSESDSRLQDRIDLRNMLSISMPADVDLAAAAVALIAERGRARGKDLHRTLQRYIALANNPDN